jgi:hypothetical protein
MNRVTRSALALAASIGVLLANPVGVAPILAQPRVPCDQLVDRLAEIQGQQAQIRGDYVAAVDAGDAPTLATLTDRFGSLLTDTDQLLARIDECSRAPVPSLAD